MTEPNPKLERGARVQLENPVCSVCGDWMMGGVPGSGEPKWFCPDHIEESGEPVYVFRCDCCEGRGWNRD